MTGSDHQYSVDVKAPVRVAYNQWTQFEEFPKSMGGVGEIRQDRSVSTGTWRGTIDNN